MKRRILSLLTALALCLSLLPTVALADDSLTEPHWLYVGNYILKNPNGPTYDTRYYVSSGSGWTQQTEKPADENAAWFQYDGKSTLTLHNVSLNSGTAGTANFNKDKAPIYAMGGDLILNVEGNCSVTGMNNIDGNSTGIYIDGSNGATLTIQGGGTLTVTGGPAQSSSASVYSRGIYLYQATEFTVAAGTTLVAGGGTAQCSSSSIGKDASYGIWMESSSPASIKIYGTVTASGADVSSSNSEAYGYSYGVYLSGGNAGDTILYVGQGGSLNATGGAVTGNFGTDGNSTGIYVGTGTGNSASGTARLIVDGAVTATGGSSLDSSYGVYVHAGYGSSSADLTVNGTLEAYSGDATDYGSSYGVRVYGSSSGTASITVTDGGSLTGQSNSKTATSSGGAYVYSYSGTIEVAIRQGGMMVVTGGTAQGTNSGGSYGLNLNMNLQGSNPNPISIEVDGTLTAKRGTAGTNRPAYDINANKQTILGGINKDSVDLENSSSNITNGIGLVTTVASVTDTGAVIDIATEPDATVYYLQDSSGTAPSADDIKESTATVTANENGIASINLSGLTANTSYTYYMIATASNLDSLVKTVTFTTNKTAASITISPQAKTNLTYNGTEQELIEAGNAEGGTMEYSLDGQNYSANIPKGTNAATYTVYYKVKGDENHSDTEPQQLTVEIGKAPRTIDAPTQSSVTTTSVTLNAATVSAGADDGKVEYGYSTSQGAQPAEWQTALIFDNLTSDTTYYFFAQVTGGKNYMDVTSSGTEITTGSKTVKKIEVTTQPNKLTYTVGEALNLTGLKITVTYSDDTTGEKSWGDEGITANPTNATTLTAEDNGKAVTITYGGKTAQTASLTVNKGSFTATVTMRDYAKGQTPREPSVSPNPGNGNVTYYYSTSATTSGGTEWTTDIGETLAAGTYYMYAIIAETDLYESCTTSAVPFKVTEASAGMVEPTARDLIYKGTPQALVTEGTIAGGTMVYSLSKNGPYSEDVPTETDAGTYTVWYKAEGAAEALGSVSVTIQKAVIVSLNIPETYQLTKPYSSGDDVLDLLQSLYDPAVGTTKDGGEIPANVPWWGRDIVFDSRPGKTNNFTWSIIITGSYVPQNYTFQADMIGSDGNVSGEIVVYNIPEEGAYTVTLNNVGTGSYGAGSYAAGTEVTIHAGDREGYVFIGWSTEDVVLNDPCSPVTTFTMPDCDVVVEALWYKEEPSHSVTLPTWDVIVEDCSHGTVEPWPEEAKMTTTITVTVTPDKGYELGSLIVTDESGNELELTDKGDGVFTFRMPNSDVTIEAEFAAIQPGYADCPRDETCPIWPFTDASTTAWYHDGVHYCLENGLMNGTVANTFSPNSATSRAMIATILWRLSGSPVVNYAMTFTDVEPGSWYAEAVRWAASQGVVTGYSDEIFAPDKAISREELAAMLYRYAQVRSLPTAAEERLSGYPDGDSVKSYAVEAVNWAVYYGIINGKDGLLAPADGATRAEAATLLARFHLLTK